MERSATRDLLSALSMPLRDVVRGLRAAGHATEPLLKGAGGQLPAGLADALRRTVSQAGEMGARSLGTAQPDAASVAEASGILRGNAGHLPTLARVLTSGLQHLISNQTEHRMMVSETVIAIAARSALHRHPDEATAAQLGAAMIRDMRDVHAIGPFPGTPFTGGSWRPPVAPPSPHRGDGAARISRQLR